MRIHEYQAKQLLRAAGIHTPEGFVAEHSNVVAGRANCMAPPLMVKAQMHAGCREKHGAVRRVHSAREAETAAFGMIGSAFGGAAGARNTVRRVLVEEALDVASEKYIALVLDRRSGKPALLTSPHAGADVESGHPALFPLSAATGRAGLPEATAYEAVLRMDLPDSLVDEGVRLIRRLTSFFFEKECLLLEINPLAVTADSRLVALDAKIEFDDYALFHHPELVPLRDLRQEGVETAGPSRVPLVRLEGRIGLWSTGPGCPWRPWTGCGCTAGKPRIFSTSGEGRRRMTSARRWNGCC